MNIDSLSSKQLASLIKLVYVINALNIPIGVDFFDMWRKYQDKLIDETGSDKYFTG